jgi:septal ring factor EnvC (AmiA/AmiB activator)
VIAARPAALVTAPWPATVRYVGPLADYAHVMVLEPEEGYLLVLAGAGVVYVSAGEVVAAGAALGLMGGREAAAGEFLAAARQGAMEASERLYLELRQGGVAIDPAAWFTAPGG